MVFSSSIFLFLFLPVVFVINYFIKEKYSNYFLLLASLVFYAWGEPIFVFLMIFSILVNWACGNLIQRSDGKGGRRAWLGVAILLDLFLLGYYKYSGMIVSAVNGIAGRDILTLPAVALPIGISFFTFQAISYVIDVYRGDAEASRNIVHTALYISFFPQLIAGPIVKYRDIHQQILRRTVSREKTAEGFRRFIYGLGKKVLIANILGACVDTIYAYEISAIDPATAWIGALAYAFQIYYDFSGYSDMAIGLGKMFGFDFLENFDYPYLSSSISEFWRRWHISLGTWFREYLYIPLGGNQKGMARTCLHLFLVFLLTGLWHGADVSFILWGACHGFFVVLERLGFQRVLKKHRVLGTLYCFLLVTLGWVLFRAENVSSGFGYLSRMLLPWQFQREGILLWEYADRRTIFAFLLAVCGAGLLRLIVPAGISERWKGSWMEGIYCALVLLLCIASIASNTYNPFIYFQF